MQQKKTIVSPYACSWRLQASALIAQSELKLERELDRARAAELVQRVEAAVCAAGAKAARQRLCREAEQGAGQVIVGKAEVRVVEVGHHRPAEPPALP